MKTSFFKRLMMPLAVMVLGIAGAFTTTSMSSAPATQVTGYRFVSQMQPCVADIKCQLEFTPTVCTSGSNTLWHKPNPNINVCDVPLYKIPTP